MICCELFFVESCLFSVELSSVCYHMFYNLQCMGRAVTNVVRTYGPTPLLYFKEQFNMFKLSVFVRAHDRKALWPLTGKFAWCILCSNRE